MNFIFFIWLSIALIFSLFEIAHPGLFLFLSFCFGALGGAIFNWLEYSLYMQLIGSLLITCFASIILFYWLRKYYGAFKKGIDHQSNVYALVGRKGLVTKTVEFEGFGFVKLNGETWMARSLDGAEIAQGYEVEVLFIRGAHVVVEKIKSTSKGIL